MAEPRIDAPKVLDGIMKEVAAYLKPHGFRKHGRTLHRFVDGDVSQAVTFQLGQSYLNQTHRLGVEVGIRVPECASRTFAPDDAPRRFYQAYMCNIRSDLGVVEGHKACWYDLRKPTAPITEDILRQIRDVVLPAFEVLHDRDAMIAHRSDFPNLDQFRHLMLLEEAMIHGRRGNLAVAKDCFRQYWQTLEAEMQSSPYPESVREHMRSIAELAERLGIFSA